MKRRFLFFFVILLWPMISNARAYTSGDCIRCHGQGSKVSKFQISLEEFKGSVHASEITCQDCHTGVRDKAHETITGAGAVECGQCHEQENRHGLTARKEDRPHCYSCHTRHGILGADDTSSSIHLERLKKTCKGCHPVECGETDYLSLLPSIRVRSHNKQDFSRTYEKDNCIGCHQGQAVHGEGESLNEQDCHLCHMGLKGRGPVTGYIHARADSEKQPIIFAAAALYQVFIAVLLWHGFRSIILRLSRRPKKTGEGKT